MRTKKQILNAVKASKHRIQKERDKLLELIAELESIGDDCDEAADDLGRAADALSRLL